MNPATVGVDDCMLKWLSPNPGVEGWNPGDAKGFAPNALRPGDARGSHHIRSRLATMAR